jgi:uncharacterized protein (TIGR02145 family)
VLYNRHVDFAKLCPAGFRVPTEEDWGKLQSYYEERARSSGNGLTQAALAKAVVQALVSAPFAAILTGCVIEDSDDPPSYVYANRGNRGSWWGAGCIFSVYRGDSWSLLTTWDSDDSDGAEGNALRLIRY